MTQEIETEIVSDFQKQEIDSAVITLWEIQLKNDEYAHFFSGLEADLSTLQFRDREDSSIINSYSAVPLEFEGFDQVSDGPSARPTITFANVLATFSDALQLSDGTTLSNADLIGKKIYMRRSLYKYAYGQSGDSPDRLIEFPINSWIIDRIQSETPLSITFELASAFHLSGIKLPRRIIMGNTCPWKYQGASEEIPHASKIGGCKWDTYGRIDINGTVRTVYMNKKDEYVFHSNIAPSSNIDPSSDDIVAGNIYRTVANTTGIFKITSTGALTSPGTQYDYWQALKTLSANQYTTPTSESNLFRQIRIYVAYNASNTFNVFTNPEYNDYVTHDRGGEVSPDPDTHPRLWKVVTRTQQGGSHNKAPGINQYWEFGDVCSKTVSGCAGRFRYKPYDYASGAGSPAVDIADVTKREGTLPFGGFPASKQFS